MAKQTFTTGQVLTAAQVNALNSNDFNQTVSVKTASYTLVAADKGTRIEFNTSGSVTCTVNTGLFDAGDTLIIQNRGAGAVTVTAGTATVNTSATLVLSQYDAGTLYFISASAAIFFNTDAGGGSPLTTKGDLFTFGTSDARLAVGTNDHVLTADSTQTLGIKWAAVPAAIPANAFQSVTALEGTSSGSYTNLTTAGPAVTLTTGTKALIILAAEFRADDSDDNCTMGFEVSGSSSIAASDVSRMAYPGSLPTNGIYICFTWAGIIDGLTAGSNTFTCKYKNTGAGTANFRNRRISVVNMGS